MKILTQSVFKTCNVCRRELELEDFHADRSMPDGRQETCGSCAVDAVKRFRDRRGRNPLTLEQKQKRKGIKLNPRAVREIRKHIMFGFSQKTIADMMGVSSSLIGRIYRREIWANIS